MKPLELAYYLHDTLVVDEIKKVAPVEKNGAYIAWIIAAGTVSENKYLRTAINEAGKTFMNCIFCLATKLTLFRYKCEISARCTEVTTQDFQPTNRNCVRIFSFLTNASTNVHD